MAERRSIYNQVTELPNRIKNDGVTDVSGRGSASGSILAYPLVSIDLAPEFYSAASIVNDSLHSFKGDTAADVVIVMFVKLVPDFIIEKVQVFAEL